MKIRSSHPNRVQGNNRPFKFNKFKNNIRYVNTPKKRVKMTEAKPRQIQEPTNSNSSFDFTPFMFFFSWLAFV